MRPTVIDAHVHVAGPGDDHPGDLYWSKEFQKGIGYRGLAVLKGWVFRKPTDRRMLATVLRQVDRARRIDAAVLLALDAVHDPDGTYRGPGGAAGPDRPDGNLSTLFVSNRFVHDVARSRPGRVLPGISVHPFRPDAAEELERWHAGAALCKWLPSAQRIDFDAPGAGPKLEAFYRRLAALKLPLLVHTGIEDSIPSTLSGADRLNDPARLEPALELGATVILAHSGTSYFDPLEPDRVDEVLRLFERRRTDRPGWDLYADVSALFSPFRLKRTLDRIFAGIPEDRLIYGSDFPNPVRGRFEPFLRVALRYRRANLLDRSARIARRELLRSFRDEGRVERVMTNLARLLEEKGRLPPGRS